MTHSTWKECHRGNVKVLSITGGGGLYCGGWSRGAYSNGFAVIDLTGNEKPYASGVRGMNDAGEKAFADVIALNAYEESLPWLSLKIKDFGVPSFEKGTWKALAKAVEELMTNGTNVVVACQGGHGRTGTVAAILIGLIYPDLGQDPLEYLRSVYCEDAVETREQHKYVNAVLGLPAPAEGMYYKHDAVKSTAVGYYSGGSSYVGGYGGYVQGGVWRGWNDDAPAVGQNTTTTTRGKLTADWQDEAHEQEMIDALELGHYEYTLKVGAKTSDINYEVCVLGPNEIVYFNVIKYNPEDKSLRVIEPISKVERWLTVEALATEDQVNAFYSVSAGA